MEADKTEQSKEKSDEKTNNASVGEVSPTENSVPLFRREFLKSSALAGALGLYASSGAAASSGSVQQSGEFDYLEASIPEIRADLVAGEITAEALTEHYLARIDSFDDTLNAFITVNDNAVDRAAALDEQLAESGPAGPLHGIPVVLKDNYDTSDLPTTGGSLALEGFVPEEDAFLVQQLRNAGAVVLGKGNMDEWAHGGAPGGGYSSLGGQTVNPYDTDRGPSGSSGGPAAAVAANLGVIAMGSDTGGSIRGPVADNALIGVKPTRGLTSRSGIIPFGLSLDVGGPMTRTVTDAAITLDVLNGVDTDDPATFNNPERAADDYTEALEVDSLNGVRLGVMRDFFGANDEVDQQIETAISDMSGEGAEIVDPIELPESLYNSIGDIYSTISDLEFKNYLNEYLAARDAPVESLEEVIELSSADDFPIDDAVYDRLIEAQERGPFTDQFYERTLETGPDMISRIITTTLEENDLDALIAPTGSCPAEPLPSADIDYQCGETPGSFRTGIANISGFPEVNVPAGFTSSGLPVSVAFLGPMYSEPTLLGLAYSYEQATMQRDPPEQFGAMES
jgi:amidase